jgi:flagellar protein FliS
MFQTMRNASAAYTKVGVDMSIESANPHKLILMLFDGALMAVASASALSKSGDMMGMSKSILKASSIISQGLRDSLDLAASGEFGVRLAALYDYMCVRLQAANLKGDLVILEEVSHLLSEIRSAWQEIEPDPAAPSQNEVAA